MRRFVPNLDNTNLTEYSSLARVIKIFSRAGSVGGCALQEIGAAGMGCNVKKTLKTSFLYHERNFGTST
jgi:hypothetical protein